MTTTNYTVPLSKELTTQAQVIFDDLGLDMATAVQLFFRQVVYKEAIPFEIARPKPTNERIITNTLSDYEKKELLRNLRGSCKDPSMVEPLDIPAEHNSTRRYDLI